MINRIVANLVGMWSRGDVKRDRAGSSSQGTWSGDASDAPSVEQTIADVVIVEIILEYCYRVHRSIRQDRLRQMRLYNNHENTANIRTLLASHHSVSKGYTMSPPSLLGPPAAAPKSAAAVQPGFASAVVKTVYCPKCFVKVHGPRFASHLEACLKKDTGNVLLSSRLGGKGAADPFPKVLTTFRRNDINYPSALTHPQSSIVRIRLNAKGIPVRHQSRIGVDAGEWAALRGTPG